jgi:hypothetical protein
MGTLIETAYSNYLTQVESNITIEEFKYQLTIDDAFNTEWSNGCTRTLTFDERYALGESIEDVRVAKVQKYGEAYITVSLNEFNIPKRDIIN